MKMAHPVYQVWTFLMVVLFCFVISFVAKIEGTPALLYIPIVQPCSPAEYLTVSVDLQTGILQPNIAYCGKYNSGTIHLTEMVTTQPNYYKSYREVAL